MNSALFLGQERRHSYHISYPRYSGAYCCNGFHEDGVRSAVEVAGRLGASL